MRFPRLAHRSAAAHKLHSTPQQDRMNLISGKGETSSRLPAFSLFLPGSCPNYRDRRKQGSGTWSDRWSCVEASEVVIGPARLSGPVRIYKDRITQPIIRETFAVGKSHGPILYLVSIGVIATWVTAQSPPTSSACSPASSCT